MSQAAIPFPEVIPPGFEWFKDEPVFNPVSYTHLTLPTIYSV